MRNRSDALARGAGRAFSLDPPPARRRTFSPMKTLVREVSGGPRAVGPYSLGAIVSGRLLFVSGQVPLNPSTGKMERGTIAQQTERVLLNIQTIVEAAGGKMDRVANCRVYLQPLTPETFAAMNEVYAKFFGKNPPTRSTIGCQLLGFDVEIDCVVALDADAPESR